MAEPTLKDVLKAISELDERVDRRIGGVDAKIDELRTEMKKGFADLDKELTGHAAQHRDREGHRSPQGPAGANRSASDTPAADPLAKTLARSAALGSSTEPAYSRGGPLDALGGDGGMLGYTL